VVRIVPTGRGPGVPRSGFTLIELLTVLAVVATLAALLLPALAGARAKAQGIQCLGNQRQLTLAWALYAHDNHDRIPYASSDGDPAKDPAVWVTGLLSPDPANRSNWDLDADIRNSPLWRFGADAPRVWRCPSDQSSVRPSSGPFRGQVVPRVRSFSMNIWMGGFGGGLELPWPGVSSPPWRLYLALGDVRDPGPGATLVLWDQRADSINYGNFFVDMQGFPDHPEQIQINQDYPGHYHNRAGNLSFADGHSEVRRWTDPRTLPPAVEGFPIVASPDNRDFLWLQHRATRRLE
jgi:prepilin-type N-terminal cleavage/methylation domain-containing protein/prepilin-type processing-associated H-X9-DG protein